MLDISHREPLPSLVSSNKLGLGRKVALLQNELALFAKQQH